MKNEQLNPEGDKQPYLNAKAAAESFLSAIDPNLRVEVVDRDVRYDDESAEDSYKWVLEFRDETNPDFRWTMDIRESDDYIRGGDFEAAVRKIYQRKVSEETSH